MIGNKELQEAIKIIDSIEGITVTKISPIYETAPVGYTGDLIFKFVFRN